MIKGRQIKPEPLRSKSGQRLTGKLTPRRQAILDTIQELTRQNYYPPTLRELKEALGLRSFSTVWLHLEQLEFGGYIERGRNRNRSIRVLTHTGERDAAVGRLAKALNLRYGLNIHDVDVFALLNDASATLVAL